MRHVRHASFPAAGLSGLLLLAGCADRLPTEPMSTPAAPSLAESVNLQATPPGYIRIGVVESAAKVAIGGTGDFVVLNKRTGAEILSGSNETVEVSMSSGVVTRTSMRLSVACIFTAEPPEEMLQQARAKGYVAYTMQITTSTGAKCWRVLLGDFPSGTSWSVRAAFMRQAIADGLADDKAWWPGAPVGITVTEGVVRYDVVRGGQTFTSPDPVVLESTEGEQVIIYDVARKPDPVPTYRGKAEVALNGTGSLAGINELLIEQYLYGVVPRELPPTVWYQPEAQKAQAVAARTFALANFNKRAADGYNLRATMADQVYGGYDAEHPVSTAAVDGTARVVATYQGNLISAYFSSTSGGYTASYEEWLDNADPIPYLKAVPDAQRGEAFAHVPSLEVFKRHANPTNLRAAAGGDAEADWSRYHRWVYDWTADEIRQVISQFAGKDVGQVREINVLQRGPSGRVLEIEYVTENGTFKSTRDGIRSSLKYVTYNRQGAAVYNNFRSTLFFIEPVHDPRTKNLVGFKAYGGGWGHGVGLSQTGAAGMAEKGKSYEEILKHYYQGITLETKAY